MARINFDEELFEDEVRRRKPRRKRRKRRKKGSIKKTCCLFFLILVIFLLLIVTAVIAKAGLVEIPVFSQLFYRLPQPTRQIDTSGSSSAIVPSLNLESASKNLVTIEITEENLTSLFRQELSGKKDSSFAENVQAVITTEGVEFSGLLIKPISVNIIFKLKPELVDHKLDFKLIQAKIGDLSIPPAFANQLVDKLLQDKIEEVNQSLNKVGQIQDIELLDGKLIVSGQLNLKLLPF